MTDVPLSYARLAAHPDIDLYHVDTRCMMAPGHQIFATRIPAGFMPDDFSGLDQRALTSFDPDHFDLAFCRTLKPFADGYLARLAQRSVALKFVNDPAGIQEQLQPGFFLDAAAALAPPTILTADTGIAERFLTAHGTIVAKRANSCGGRGVYRIARTSDGRARTENVVEGERGFDAFPALFAHLTADGTEQILLMRYLSRVIEGDRRIVVVDGQIFGTYVRRSSRRDWIQNVSAGAVCELVPVEPEDQRLVDATCEHYREAGIHILGYDLLLDDDGSWRISEINAGNIGGLFRIEYLGVAGVADRFVDWLHHFAAQGYPEPRRAGAALLAP